MKSHTMIAKTLSEHIIMAILYFWVKNVFFFTKIVSSIETSDHLQKQQYWVN